MSLRSGSQHLRGGDVQEQLFEFARDQHHVRTEGVDELAGGGFVNPGATALGRAEYPPGCISFVHAGKLDQAAPVAERFADAVKALAILHVHAAEVGGEMEVIGEEDEQRLRVGRATIGMEGCELFFFRSPGVELLQVPDKK